MAQVSGVSGRSLMVGMGIGIVLLTALRASVPQVEGIGRAPNDTNGRPAEASIGVARVRTSDGALVPLVDSGVPAIVMISSTTCAWCKRALGDIGAMSNGRGVPRLKLLTLEGASLGKPMLAREHIGSAQLIGPASESDQVLLTFRYNGTPTFVAIDRRGRVVRTMPGYPSREEMRHWLAVMTGDAEVP